MLRFIASVFVICVAVVFLQNGGSAESRAHAAGSWINHVALTTVAATRSFVLGATQGASTKTARTEASQVTASAKTSKKVEATKPLETEKVSETPLEPQVATATAEPLTPSTEVTTVVADAK